MRAGFHGLGLRREGTGAAALLLALAAGAQAQRTLNVAALSALDAGAVK